MSGFELRTADVRVLLWHLTLHGLGAILPDAGVADVRLSWTGGMRPRPRVGGPGLTAAVVGDAVRAHAQAHAAQSSWVSRDVELAGSKRGLMSPRLSVFADQSVWERVQGARQEQIDQLMSEPAWLDLRMVCALGEPCYWSRNRKGDALQDDGSSRFEMQPRNKGSEFVGTRLRRLAQAVAARSAGSVASGLAGASTRDEAGNDAADSRTSTGLAAPGPTDNAVAWCALWGISQLPQSPRVNATAVTSAHIGRSRAEWFAMPVWHSEWRPARLRSVLASRQLVEAAGVEAARVEPTRAATAHAWLSVRGVAGVIRFPIDRFGSDSAPERRAMLGVTVPVA